MFVPRKYYLRKIKISVSKKKKKPIVTFYDWILPNKLSTYFKSVSLHFAILLGWNSWPFKENENKKIKMNKTYRNEKYVVNKRREKKLYFVFDDIYIIIW